MKTFKERKTYLVFMLIMSVFIGVLSGCGTSNNPATAGSNPSVANLSPAILGEIEKFGVFGGGSGMTNQGIFTVVNGNIGTTAVSTLITGFHDTSAVYTETPLNIGTVNGTIYTATAPPGSAPGVIAAAAALAAQSAFDNLSPAALPGGMDVSSLGGGAGELGGRTLSPGIYQSAPGSFAIQGGDLTLDARNDPNAVWVFQMASSLIVGGPGAAFPQSVLLVNGAQAKNVFWQVGSSATINAAGGGTMVGTIISYAATTFSTAGNVDIVTLEGRALALNASVTMVNTHINVPALTIAPNSAKAISAYSLNGATGTINETAKNIAVTMPYGTDVKALVATFTTTGKGLTAGTPAMPQTSGTTANNFTSPVTYTVTAADSSTATYTVTVSVSLNSAKAISVYSFNGVAGTIDEAAKTIAVTLSSGTNVTALVATFTTTGASVKVGAAAQTSGTTPNNFTSLVAYTVTAADSTTATYTVTVTVTAALNPAKAITAYSLNGVKGTISETAKTIAVTMPKGTSVTALVATFTTTGASVKVVAAAQTSGTTPNNFTSPVAYTVTAADGTTATYNVTVTVSVTAAAGPLPVNLGTAGNFVILAKTGVSTTGTTAVVGDIGLSPSAASYLTGFGLIADSTNTFSTSSLVTGKLYSSDYAPPTPAYMTTSIGDMETAFTDAAGRTLPDFTELGAGDISGLTLVPGLYKWGTGVLVTNAGVTLTGGANDVWIFQIAQDLTVSNSSIITLAGGAQAKNIFWQVSGQATLGTAADFKGIILSQTLISLNTGAKMNGRALAQSAVTLDATAITAP